MKTLPASVLIAIGVLLGALASVGVTAIIQQPIKEKIVIAVQPTLSATSVLQQAKSLESFLEDNLGIDVEIYVPTSYAAVVEAVRRGHAHAALMSAWPSYLAWKLGGADVVLAEVRDVSVGDKRVNSTHYYSYWVVPKDSDITTLEQLKGKTVALPSPLSTSGYLAPLAKLVERGLIKVPEGREADPSGFVKVVFAGGYAQAWEALKSGNVEAIVIAGDIPLTLYNEVLSNTRIIATQGPIPSHAVVFSKELKEPLRSKLLDALMLLGEERPDIMRNFVSALFVKFTMTNSEEHLSQLDHYIRITNLKYTERLG